MKIINKKWIIYIYIIFLVTILLTLISFIFNYLTWNLEIYLSVKNYFSSYWNELAVKEEMVTHYFDNPKNMYYIDAKYYDKNIFLSRYKEYLEYTLNVWEVFELSLTSFDEEYNNSLKNLKYIDLYWWSSENICNINISHLRREKGNTNTILNKKQEIIWENTQTYSPTQSQNTYKNKYKITDSFQDLNKNKYEYKILIESNTLCNFYLEWFDSKNNRVKLPSNNLSWEIKNFENIKNIFITKKIKIWNIELSHYLYKF